MNGNAVSAPYRDQHQANALRWRPGLDNYYEIWYLTLNHLPSETGYWIRYTLHAPQQGAGDACLEVWFTFFDRRRPESNFGLAQRFPIDCLEAEAEPFRLSIGDNSLENGACRGALDGAGHSARWDLRFSPCERPFLHFPESLYTGGQVESAMLAPHLSTRFTGTIEAGGRRFELAGDPGEQSKTWGRRHPPHWLWAHCNHFAEDPEAVMELVCAPQMNPGEPPPAHIVCLKCHGRQFHLMSLVDGSRSASDAAPGHWRLQAESGNFRLDAAINCRPDDLIEARYTDPNGAASYCVHTEVADAELQAWTRDNESAPWQPLALLHSHCTTHTEWGDETPHPKVTRKITMLPSAPGGRHPGGPPQ